MTGPEHYKAAEHMLQRAEQCRNEMANEGDWSPLEMAAGINLNLTWAQVHATLALAAATALPHDPEWIKAAGGSPVETGETRG